MTVLHDCAAAAARLGLTEAAFRQLVYRQQGPVVTRIGRRVRFSDADLQAYVEAHRVPPPPARSRGRRLEREG